MILRKIKRANKQTKFLLFMAFIYLGALFWTTLQVYSRLMYTRLEAEKPIVISNENPS